MMDVLWLRPTVGTHVSTRRERVKEGLQQRGVEVTIVDTSGTDAIEAISTALSGDFDVIVGTVRVGLYVGFLLAKLKRVPFVAEVTEPVDRVDDLPHPLYRLVEWYEFRVLKRADARFFVEQEVLQDANRRGIDGTLAKNAVWFEQFAEPDADLVERAQEQLESIGVDVTAPIAIYIGALTERQHILEILEASEECPHWQFLFLGETGELSDRVTAAAEAYDNVHFAGSVPHREVPGYLSFSTVGFALSQGERPLKLLEYGAAGLTVLGTRGRREHEFSADEIYFIEPTPEAIAEALETVRLRPNQSPVDGKALQAIAEKNSWDDVADKYFEVFTDLTD